MPSLRLLLSQWALHQQCWLKTRSPIDWTKETRIKLDREGKWRRRKEECPSCSLRVCRKDNLNTRPRAATLRYTALQRPLIRISITCWWHLQVRSLHARAFTKWWCILSLQTPSTVLTKMNCQANSRITSQTRSKATQICYPNKRHVCNSVQPMSHHEVCNRAKNHKCLLSYNSVEARCIRHLRINHPIKESRKGNALSYLLPSPAQVDWAQQMSNKENHQICIGIQS